MATWGNPDSVQRPSTGGTIISAWGDQVNDDLNLLHQSLQCISTIGLVASAPVVFAQYGNEVHTTNSFGNVTIAFIQAFPNVCDMVMCQNGDANASFKQLMTPSTISAAGFVVTAVDSTTGAAFANVSVRVMWMAVGR